MKHSSAYYRAAERIANETGHIDDNLTGSYFCCIELSGQSRDKFSEYFNPEIGRRSWFGDADIPENQLARSLALLFMDQIEKDEVNGK